MKKNTVLKIFIIVLALFIIVLLIFFGKNFNNEIFLNNEEKQIVLLKEIYNDFIQNSNKYNVTLDSSAQKNIITKNYFKDDDIESLKKIVKKENNSTENAILYISYSKKDKILRLTLKKIENEQEVVVITQNYKLYIKNRKIKFNSSTKEIRM